jgi:hypothetical protein
MAMHEAAHSKSIRLSPQTLLVGVPDGRSWLVVVGQSEVKAVPISAVAAGHASLAASLVEGALYAGLTSNGETARAAAEGTESSGPYTLCRYIRWLAGNAIFAAQTPGLFRRGAERFEAMGRPDLAAFARKKAAEETGHAELAYRDLEELGLPAASVVRLIEPPSASAFVEQFRNYVESDQPIALFGFSYGLERLAVERDEPFIRRVEAMLPVGTKACRFLKVHSTAGSDRSHVHEQLSHFASLSDSEIETIVGAVNETAAMLARQPLMDKALSDHEIEHRLRQAGIEMIACPSAPLSQKA